MKYPVLSLDKGQLKKIDAHCGHLFQNETFARKICVSVRLLSTFTPLNYKVFYEIQKIAYYFRIDLKF